MNLNYRDYFRGLVSFGSNLLNPIRCSRSPRGCYADFLTLRKGVPERLGHHFFVWLWGTRFQPGGRGTAICIFHASGLALC